METNNINRYLTPPQVARRLGVNAGKVGQFIKTGSLAAIDVSLNPGTGRPRWRIKLEDLAAFEQARRSTPPLPAPARTKRSSRPAVPEYV